MSTDVGSRVSEVLPSEAWDTLKTDENSVLIDVRSAAEWGFVGVPELSSLGKEPHFIEWARYPGMIQNPDFVSDVMKALDGSAPSMVFFMCRSGVRSLNAAKAVAEACAAQGVAAKCVNVAEGFEGDLDSLKHRGTHSGWKARGLSWRQS